MGSSIYANLLATFAVALIASSPAQVAGAEAILHGESPQGVPDVSIAPPSTTTPSSDALDDEYDALFDDEFGLDDDESLARIDPFEEANRTLLKFNRAIDRVFWNPITTVYRFIVPTPMRLGVRNAFGNLRSPVVMMNQLLQGRVKDAGETLCAFALNATAGVGGLFNAAKETGWEIGDEDFGQTLAKAGVASGPYIIVPIFGPNTIRDGFGGIVDVAFDPATYLLGPIQGLFVSGPRGFALREEAVDDLAALEESSVDYYAAMRSAYLQTREAKIQEP